MEDSIFRAPGRSAALVLLVEREGPARDLEAQLIRNLGCDVTVVADGKSALERAQQLMPSLVVTEILLPQVDGLQLCRQLKEMGIRVLIVSMLAASARAREAGADGFLTKPISQARLGGEVLRLVPQLETAIEERA